MSNYWEKKWQEVNREGYDRNNARHREIRSNYGVSSGVDGVRYGPHSTAVIPSNTGNGFSHASHCMCSRCNR